VCLALVSACTADDHQETVPIEGGASIHLVASDTVPPCYQARNCMPDKPVCTPFIIDGIPPAPAAFDGQFIQIDVVSVTQGSRYHHVDVAAR
jgi:hypothetical protein